MKNLKTWIKENFNSMKNVAHAVIATYVSYVIVEYTGIATYHILEVISLIFLIGAFGIGVPAFMLEGIQGIVSDDGNPHYYRDVFLGIVFGWIGGTLSIFIDIPVVILNCLLVFTILALIAEAGNLTRLYLAKKRNKK